MTHVDLVAEAGIEGSGGEECSDVLQAVDLELLRVLHNHLSAHTHTTHRHATLPLSHELTSVFSI